MKYYCIDCLSEFNDPESYELKKSNLVNLLVIKCPFCLSDNISLSKKYKLTTSRKQKIKKLNNQNE